MILACVLTTMSIGCQSADLSDSDMSPSERSWSPDGTSASNGPSEGSGERNLAVMRDIADLYHPIAMEATDAASSGTSTRYSTRGDTDSSDNDTDNHTDNSDTCYSKALTYDDWEARGVYAGTYQRPPAHQVVGWNMRQQTYNGTQYDDRERQQTYQMCFDAYKENGDTVWDAATTATGTSSIDSPGSSPRGPTPTRPRHRLSSVGGSRDTTPTEPSRPRHWVSPCRQSPPQIRTVESGCGAWFSRYFNNN